MTLTVDCWWADGTKDFHALPFPLPPFFKLLHRRPDPPLGAIPSLDDTGPTVHLFERVWLAVDRTVYIECGAGR